MACTSKSYLLRYRRPTRNASNLAGTYEVLGRPEALQMKRDVYTGYLKLYGAEHRHTIEVAGNYANSLFNLNRFKKPGR